MTNITPLQALRAIGLTDAEIRDGAEGNVAAAAPRIHAACIRATDELDPERIPVTRDTPLGTEIAHDGASRRCSCRGDGRPIDQYVESDDE